ALGGDGARGRAAGEGRAVRVGRGRDLPVIPGAAGPERVRRRPYTSDPACSERARAREEARMTPCVAPAYDEERVLGATLDSIHAAARIAGEPYEIVVADD